jgi:hypothetical protein
MTCNLRLGGFDWLILATAYARRSDLVQAHARFGSGSVSVSKGQIRRGGTVDQSNPCHHRTYP